MDQPKRKRGRPRKNPLPEEPKESLFDLDDPIQQVVEPKKEQSKQRVRKGCVAVGWCIKGETTPSSGRAVDGVLIDREDVKFDGFEAKEFISVGRYFGFVLVDDFILQLQKVANVATIWKIFQNGNYEEVWSADKLK